MQSAVETIKRELPNTNKRMSRVTYKSYLKNKAIIENQGGQANGLVNMNDPDQPYKTPSRVTKFLQNQNQ